MSKQARLIENSSEVEENLETLEDYRRTKNEYMRDFYKSHIKLGVGFVVTGEGKNYRLGPSRFVGYAENTAYDHVTQHRNGGASDQRLKTVLGRSWNFSAKEEATYLKFCAALGIKPTKKKRRYIRLDAASPNQKPEPKRTSKSVAADVDDISQRTDITQTEKESLIQARRGQGRFRRGVCRVWQNRCAVCKCTVTEVLRASHMKPWASSTDKERLDPNNGILLAPNIDALFDKGLVTFDDNGKILFSRKLKKPEAAKLGVTPACRIKFSAKHLPYIRCHREKVFKP